MLDGLADAVGDGVSGGHAEEEGGAGVAVIPYGEGSLEMGQADDGAAVEGSIDGAEAQDLGLGTAGGGAAQAGTELAQGGITIAAKARGPPGRGERGFRASRRPSRGRGGVRGRRRIDRWR